MNAGDIPLQCLQPNTVYMILPKDKEGGDDGSTSGHGISIFELLQYLACNRLALVCLKLEERGNNTKLRKYSYFFGILTDLPKLITRVCQTPKNYLGFPESCGILSFDY